MRDWTQIRAGHCHCDPISERKRLCFTSNGPLPITRNRLVHDKTNAKTESLTLHKFWLHYHHFLMSHKFAPEHQKGWREYCDSDWQFD